MEDYVLTSTKFVVTFNTPYAEFLAHVKQVREPNTYTEAQKSSE